MQESGNISDYFSNSEREWRLNVHVLFCLSPENEVIEETKHSYHKDFSHSFPDLKRVHTHTRQRRSTGEMHTHSHCAYTGQIYGIKTVYFAMLLFLYNKMLMCKIGVSKKCSCCRVSVTFDLFVLLQWWRRPYQQCVRCGQQSMRSPGARWIPPQPTSSSGRPVLRWSAAPAAATPATWGASRLASTTAPSRYTRKTLWCWIWYLKMCLGYGFCALKSLLIHFVSQIWLDEVLNIFVEKEGQFK